MPENVDPIGHGGDDALAHRLHQGALDELVHVRPVGASGASRVVNVEAFQAAAFDDDLDGEDNVERECPEDHGHPFGIKTRVNRGALVLRHLWQLKAPAPSKGLDRPGKAGLLTGHELLR